MTLSAEIVDFWINQVGPKGWYMGGEELDAQIREKFEAHWHDAMEGAFGPWLIDAQGTLAYLILTDQFPRNMFREDARAFASDTLARAAAKQAITQNWDQEVDPKSRQFFFLPLMHSENLVDQDRSVELFRSRMDGEDGNVLHAEAHRAVIRAFGRFPYRNAALGRDTTTDEQRFLEAGAYGGLVKRMSEGAKTAFV